MAAEMVLKVATRLLQLPATAMPSSSTTRVAAAAVRGIEAERVVARARMAQGACALFFTSSSPCYVCDAIEQAMAARSRASMRCVGAVSPQPRLQVQAAH